MDVPACTWSRRYSSSTQYALLDSEEVTEVDNYAVLKKVILTDFSKSVKLMCQPYMTIFNFCMI